MARALATLMMLSALAGACARGGGAARPAPVLAEDAHAAVTGAVEQWRQALEVRSLDALAKVYAQDDALVVVRQGVATRGWAAVSAELSARVVAAKEVRVRVADLAIAPLGQAAAVATARLTHEVSDGITNVAEDGALTLVLRRVERGWEIASQHFSYSVR